MNSDELLPLSAAQHGIWAGQRLDPDSPAYNTGEYIALDGPLDPALFAAAARRAVAEAEALHARFADSDGGPRQRIAPLGSWTLPLVDLSAAPDPDWAAEVWMRADLDRPVDLARGPLWGQALIRLAPGRHRWYQRAHHIALDGFGFGLLARRAAACYSALVAGQEPPGRPFGPLRAVLDEDAAYQTSPARQRDRAFWAERFGDRPAPPSLAARAAPAGRSFVRRSRMLAEESAARLQALARQSGVTWAELVIAAVATYLLRQTGAPEQILGLPVMARMGSAALRVPCMAMNIVPLRVAVQPRAGFVELARGVARELRAVRPHQRYRYEQLRRDLRLIGGERRLFGPVVNLMPFDTDLDFGGLAGAVENLSAGPVEDLSISLYARPDLSRARVGFDANPACYRPEELEAHQEGFLALLDELLDAPERPLRASARPPAPARAPAPPADDGPLGEPRPVVELFLERAREQPDAPALEHGPERLTYAELAEAARRLAEQLAAQGAGPDRLVALALPRGVEAVVAILGVLRAGAAYQPLDPHGPPARSAALLADSGAALLLTTAEHTDLLDGAAQVLPLDLGGGAGWQAGLCLCVKGGPDAPRAPAPAPEAASEAHLAYLIYTSGSTGQPKGVMVSRGALAAFVQGATRRYGLRRDERVLQFAPLHFDASVEEIFLTLCAGATLVLRTEEMLQSVARLLERCGELRISLLDLPTALWHELAYSVSTGAAALPPSVRTVIIGGEAALPERVARWHAAVPPAVRLINTYGPTETTVVALSAVLEAGDPDSGEAAPIGTPLPGLCALALDPRGRPVAPGEVGELYLGGPTLARGYLGRPDLTTEKFVPNPFADQRPTTSTEKADQERKTEDEAGAGESLSGAQEHSDVVPTLYRSNALPLQRSNTRLYRTGDLVRRRGDGQLVFVGRADDEFKISGHRIDPGEVEARLLGHPRVREAVVVGQELPGGVRRLAAFVVAEEPAPSAAELRRHLLAALPAAVVPSSVSFCARLPRSSSGKIDRAALKTALSDQAEPESAATELERAVLEVWGQVLGRAGLAAQDDFFELGGQSLQTLQVSSRLGAALGREVPVALLFRHPTAAALAQALERQAGADSAPPEAALPPALLADAALPAEVTPLRAGRPGALQRVLLTGATGFVGTYLLHELLAQTGAQVDCLVRAASPDEGLARIESALAAQGLPAAGLAGRVRALPADLARPRLGLSGAQFEELAASCDALYHSAALVSVLRSYQSLRAVNVYATLDLLRLAAARCAPLHHISTLAVAPPAALSAEVREAFVEAHPGLRDGYQQSKWAAERLLEQASARGLPVAVYRLGRVVGAPGGGAANPQDLLWQILRAGVAAGVLPELDLDEIWTPADYVARAVVRLSLSDPAGVFNLAPEAPVPLRALAGWVREYGYPVATCPPAEWPARLAHSGHATVLSALEAFAHSAKASAGQLPPGLGRIHAGRVAQGLVGSGIVCPPPGRGLVWRTLDTCVATGLLPPPPTAADLPLAR